MQKEEFINSIENLTALNENTAEELKKVTEDFPWFSLGWVLYLKNLRQINSPEFNAILKKVAIRVSNRKLLHDFLNAETISPGINTELGKSFSLFNI